jgi:hypothetical protein
MKKKVLIVAAFVATLATVSSCKKTTTTPTPPNNAAPTVTAPSDADGAFVLVNTITYNITTAPIIGTIISKIELGTAAAWLGAPNAFVDAGAIKCQDSLLTKQANNAYVFVPNSLTGINKSSNTKWDVAGAGSVTGFSFTHSASFPSVDSIENAVDVNTANDFTLSSKGFVSNSDSVIFVVSGPNGSVQKIKPSNTKSCTFTASEMSTVGTGNNSGLLQIAPYRLTSSTLNGKKYYFVKETCVSKFVNLK